MSHETLRAGAADVSAVTIISRAADQAHVSVNGEWTIEHAAELDRALAALDLDGLQHLVLDLAGINTLDTAGAWLLVRTVRAQRERRTSVRLTGVDPRFAAILKRVASSYVAPRPASLMPNALIRIVASVGANTLRLIITAGELVAFLGNVFVVLVRSALHPGRLRFTSTVFHMEQVGLNAVPIVSLLAFLIGIVLAYQGALQLRQFGAEIFTVDLVAISVLRELGILLTAIIVAGRSGSAFAAQIGSMKVREEIDAMRTFGIDPLEVLVLPRTFALIVMLPLLAFLADIMGLLGGAIMCWIALDIPPEAFLERVKDGVGLWTFWVGIVKAPVFGALIAIVGCFEGFQVQGSAESVGQRTTRSVVESIFLVIIADALFSVFFGVIGI